MACTHPKEPGRKRCNLCNAQYFRDYRKTRESLDVRRSRSEGITEGLRVARVALLERGDIQLTGFEAAEVVRKAGDAIH